MTCKDSWCGGPTCSAGQLPGSVWCCNQQGLMQTDDADLIIWRAGGQHCLPNGLFGAIADDNLVWAVLQLVFALQLVADGLPQGCRACVWSVMSVALPACSHTPAAAGAKPHLTARACAPLAHTSGPRCQPQGWGQVCQNQALRPPDQSHLRQTRACSWPGL